MSAGLRERMLAGYARRGWRGFDRLLRLSGHRPGQRLRARSRHGAWFELDPWSYIDRFVLTEGFYESEVLEAVVDDLGDGEVFWDVGANLGLHAVSAKLLRPRAQVVAFEPAPAMRRQLARHAELNAVAVDILAVALSDRAGEAVFHLAPAGNTGMSSLSPWPDVAYAETTVVETAPGDQLVASGRLPAPTVIKLDVEGHEPQVLRGLRATLTEPACRRVIFEDARAQETEPKTLLREAGFAIAPLRRRERSDSEVDNFLALKR